MTFETTRRRHWHAPLLPCLLTLPPPGVCLMLSLEPHLACTLLKSNFWSSIWTWKNKEVWGKTSTFTMRTVCHHGNFSFDTNNKRGVCNSLSEGLYHRQISELQVEYFHQGLPKWKNRDLKALSSFHSKARREQSGKETTGTDFSEEEYFRLSLTVFPNSGPAVPCSDINECFHCPVLFILSS